MSDTIQSLLDETLSLQHYGVKGQKWGQRRYQNPDGTYTDEGKKRRRVGYTEEEKSEADKVEGKAYKDMTRKERRAAKKRARHNEAERRERREFNREKEEAMRKGDLKFAEEHLDKFTNQEITDLITRYKKMQELKDVNKANKKDAEYFVDKAVKYLNLANKVAKPVTELRDTINRSNQTAANAKKAQLDYQKALHPEKYKEEKSDIDKKKDILALQKAEDEARKAKAEADKAVDQARLTRITTDKQDPEVQAKLQKQADEVARIKQEQAEEADRKAKKMQEKLDEKQKKEDEKREKEEEKERRKQAKKVAREQDIDVDEAEELLKNFDPNESAKSIVDRYYSPEKAKENKSDWDEYQDWLNNNVTMYYSGGPNSKSSVIEKILGADKVKDYRDYKPSANRTYSIDGLNKESRKAIKKLEKEGKSTTPDLPRDYTRDKKWTKDMKKHDSHVIDQWVKDMKKKYMKERNMSAAAAEEKAEEYVDAWINAYDEGKIRV